MTREERAAELAAKIKELVPEKTREEVEALVARQLHEEAVVARALQSAYSLTGAEGSVERGVGERSFRVEWQRTENGLELKGFWK